MSQSTVRQSLLMRLAGAVSAWLPRSVRQDLYRIPILSSAVRKCLNVMAPRGLAEITVVAGRLQGARLRLDLKSEKYYWLGTYEPMLERAVEDFIHPGIVAYDVGAHIGYVSLLLARAVGPSGQVFAFEPLPSNIERLKAHLALNNADNVRALQIAASDIDGQSSFRLHASSKMGKLNGILGRDTEYAAEIEVTTIRLDSFVYRDGNPLPQLIKMDIEGGGEKAIPGMECILSEAHPIIFAELHGPQEANVVWTALRKHGYRVQRMCPGYPELKDVRELDWKEYIIGMPS